MIVVAVVIVVVVFVVVYVVVVVRVCKRDDLLKCAPLLRSPNIDYDMFTVSLSPTNHSEICQLVAHRCDIDL